MIAIIDDDQGVRSALCNLLDSAGYLSCGFASAEDFLADEARLQPTCALIDVELPQMSGFTLVAQLATRAPRLPVILMSAHGSSAYHTRALQLGALELLVKPVLADTLLACIARARAAAGLA
ncbi:response regulator transcription factor [Herbaspirillum sp. alder98]|uniref:response regulator transcription factor n=1 Tax=Herbaspirillum sp. alder98 TaxID=2913096 RepID=UPI001CD82596|nr:response regulator [Herbaspirillum sp. alder98]MCA1326767.1 response regulator [Herbaspirillum sp. alder98]